MGSKPVHPPDSGNENHTRPRLASRLTTHPDGREECTIYPADATPETQLTRWISAFDGSFVDLDAME
ncbi:DUF7511 domain-containing protein [Haloferax volcanii]|uniref:DUF7511 domain-containing protein n=3 Tax=Haloferax volcanii TaxID=2246 RepID=A0A384KV86_HALVD|nr:hypothetical protein [Haloferax volcanii]ADE04961.1 uncharacterized protein HVO_1115 [Haloferax volcanii DS2]ELY28195.1 hypothetical protein C498_13168 [Haloferax volcanii DS2]MBS8117563.1 hypothetical protein [Haloferax volcanii]MBS8122575.1 hypothetical protein [Haloferax volcanii]MBS8126443.1 hypothetical protein [Haloferax volcanii]